jgi:hypothetical protein
MVPTTQPSQHAVHSPHARAGTLVSGITAPWHFLNLSPLPQGQASLRPTDIASVY